MVENPLYERPIYSALSTSRQLITWLLVQPGHQQPKFVWKSFSSVQKGLTHWGRVTHICVSKINSVGSDNGLSPGRRQAIIWTITGILLIGPLGTNFSEILIGIQTFSFKKMHLKMSSAKWRPFVSASMCLSFPCRAQNIPYTGSVSCLLSPWLSASLGQNNSVHKGLIHHHIELDSTHRSCLMECICHYEKNDNKIQLNACWHIISYGNFRSRNKVMGSAILGLLYGILSFHPKNSGTPLYLKRLGKYHEKDTNCLILLSLSWKIIFISARMRDHLSFETTLRGGFLERFH